MAYDVCGVQPMTGPTGLIFALRAKYEQGGSAEALYNEAATSVAAGTTNSSPDMSGNLGDPLGTGAQVHGGTGFGGVGTSGGM